MRLDKTLTLLFASILSSPTLAAAGTDTATETETITDIDTDTEPQVGTDSETRPVHGDDGVPELTIRSLESPARARARSIHPDVLLLDENGEPVARSAGALSLTRSCGECHDADYIEEHNYHASAGLEELHEPGARPTARPWDISPGLFGRFDPMLYRTLTPRGFEKLDMGTADWIRTMGPRHVGGGPAEVSRTGERLTELQAKAGFDPETHVLDPETGRPVPWDWQESGTVELNCLLCHTQSPNNALRIQTLTQGKFRWASTATLVGGGIVNETPVGFAWNPGAFKDDGKVEAAKIGISDPTSASCRQCHGRACRCADPVIFENSLSNWATETTGHVYSPEQVFESGMNVAGKAHLWTPWDVHAQRLLECADCHHSLNNPAYNQKESLDGSPSHLKFDARRLSEGDYLITPDHNFAKGHTAQGTVARRFDGSMRGCRDCHDAESVHDFLPNKRTHFEKVGCQTCHIPRVLAPVRKSTDWTLLGADRGPLVDHRGVQGEINRPESLITGYEPTLLMHEEIDDRLRVGPHNLITSWYWIESEPPRPVRKRDLEKALFAEDGYHPDVIAALDHNGDRSLSRAELRLDTQAKVDAVADRLKNVGVVEPRIRGEMQPYTVSHGVLAPSFAIRDCESCHGFDSRITRTAVLADYAPGGVAPSLVEDSTARIRGEIVVEETGRVVFHPSIDRTFMYVHGTNQLAVWDILGLLLVLGTLAGVIIHGGLRFVASRKRAQGESR